MLEVDLLYEEEKEDAFNYFKIHKVDLKGILDKKIEGKKIRDIISQRLILMGSRISEVLLPSKENLKDIKVFFKEAPNLSEKEQKRKILKPVWRELTSILQSKHILKPRLNKEQITHSYAIQKAYQFLAWYILENKH